MEGFLTIVSFIFSMLFFIYLYKYIKIKKVLNELNKPLRKGYYKQGLVTKSKINFSEEKEEFYSTIYVIELDRYTSGESKIKIDYIEPGIQESKMPKSKIENFIKETFKSIVKTSDINWLDSELSIKEMRREKLSKIKKSFKLK